MAKYRRLIKRRHTTSIDVSSVVASFKAGEDMPLNRASRRLLAHANKNEHMLRLRPESDMRKGPK